MAKDPITSEPTSVKLRIWDTVGQERYRAIPNNFYRDIQICILVYDITDEKSFKSVDNWRMEFTHKGWTLNQLEEEDEHFFFLVGNKVD